MKKGEKATHDQQDYLNNSLEQESLAKQYKGDFGGYRPHFEGSNPNILPNTWKTHVAWILLCLPAYILSIGLFIFCIWWGTTHQDSYTFTCLGLLLGTIVLSIIISYIGQLDRRKREKDYIMKKEAEMQKVAQIVKREHEEADNLLISSRR